MVVLGGSPVHTVGDGPSCDDHSLVKKSISISVISILFYFVFSRYDLNEVGLLKNELNVLYKVRSTLKSCNSQLTAKRIFF